MNNVRVPVGLLRKGAIPAAFIAALTGPFAIATLERFEGNVLAVYADNLAGGLPTYCAGATDRKAVVGTKLTSDQCKEVNKTTILDYGYAVLACTEWKYLTPTRLVGLTMFAINVGKEGACGSAAVRSINAGQVTAGCNLLAYKPNGQPNWSNAGGQFVNGLFNRRKAERVMCLDSI
ncbi:glycoside hydrolase family 24 [Herminiimonas sp. KBW02]|uniref:lysozyme n=1 Tax=Herminiimonas sp. KBW02 TaxID=2153363 RepID=UPI000F5A71B9|nr:glycoside hydrolase family protein [Herminiimonas sp. KBW02]RQO38605.1 glycoside hydrolase family 24 [Herminiimonas sp. KBW02]